MSWGVPPVATDRGIGRLTFVGVRFRVGHPTATHVHTGARGIPAMTWFARTRWWLPAGLVVLGAVALTTYLAAVTFAIPKLAHPTGLEIPATLAMPIFAAVAIVSTTVSRAPAAELVAARPVVRLDCLATSGFTAVAWLLYSACAYAVSLPFLLASGRNALGLVGIGLAVRRWIDPAGASAVSVAYLVGVLGLGDRADPGFLDWPLARPEDPRALAVAGALFCVGLLVLSRRRYRERLAVTRPDAL